jgi:multidrug efflux pump subunit AcrB
LAVFVLPRLPKEIVGLPDTDMMVLDIGTSGNTLSKQMQDQCDATEREFLNKFGDKIVYTFSMVNGPNEATVFGKLKDKSEMRDIWKKMEAHFANTPNTHYTIVPWNPSELPIPDPPDMRLAIRGGTPQERMHVAQQMTDLLQDNKLFSRVNAIPLAEVQHGISLSPHIEQWEALRDGGARFSATDLADVARVATTGRWIGYFPIKDRSTDIILRYPTFTINSIEDVGAFPIGIGAKLVPLRALADVSLRVEPPDIYRKDMREMFAVEGKENQEKKTDAGKDLERAKQVVAEWQQKRASAALGSDKELAGPSLSFEDAAQDLNEAIHQLGFAVGLSILLILLTLIVQFGSIAEPLLVLISVPLGFIGVLH